MRPTSNELAALVGTLADLNGRATEVSRRMGQDALLLVELQQKASVALTQIWALPSPTPPSPVLPSAPQMVRVAEVCKRVGLARSTIWKLVKENRFPSPRRISLRAIGWSVIEIDEWLQTRPTNRTKGELTQHRLGRSERASH